MLSDFEIRPTAFLDDHTEPTRFDIVKWIKTEPHEVVDWHTGKKRMSSRFCFSVATAQWNPKEPCWEFKSVGTRFLEYYEKGLCEEILEMLQAHIPEEDDYE